MSLKIHNIDELKKVVDCNNLFIIVGTGWIGKLLYYSLINIGISDNSIEVSKGNETPTLNWNFGIYDYINKVSDYDKKIVIVAYQENEAREYANYLEDTLSCNSIYYISEKTKNELDDFLMTINPDCYEEEVLVGRKIELDDNTDKKLKESIRELELQSEFPIFKSIEIETINRCNGTCSFCPVNRNDDPRPLKKMTRELFEKIIGELSDMRYDGRLNLYSNNEPLIDDRIVEFAEYAKEKVTQATLTLFTNCTLLTLDKFKNLIKWFDLVVLDIYYDNDIMSEISDNIRPVFEMGLENKDIQKKVMVQFIRREALRNNRGGQSKNRKVTYQVKSGCALPFIQLIVRPDGKTSLCCNDPIGKNTLGDVSQNTLKEVWNSKAYVDIRNAIGQTRQNIGFCKDCDNFASNTTNVGRVDYSETECLNSWIRVREEIEV
jgi:radical SAM protein with 4Fe4S-binding SPASM domain